MENVAKSSVSALPSTSAVEDWTEGDFDLDSQEICLDRARLQVDAGSEHSGPPSDHDDENINQLQDLHHSPHVRGSFDFDDEDEELPWDVSSSRGTHDVDDASDEQTDTIKLSNAAGSALKQLIEASKSNHARSDDLDQLDTFEARTFDGIPYYDDDDDAPTLGLQAMRPSSASMSASTSTSYTSTIGLSTDLTEPDTPSSKDHSRSTCGSAPSSSGISTHGDSFTRSDIDLNSEEDNSLEMDFELASDVNELSLCPSLSRARSQASLIDKDNWGDEVSSSMSSSVLAVSIASVGSSNLSSGSTPNQATSEESDADDEHEDLLDGIELSGSIFEADQNTQGQMKQKLDAILDLKRAGYGNHEASRSRTSTDIETDMAAGLVITDDLDLSPSRITSKLGLSTRGRFLGPQSFAQRQASLPAGSLTTRSALMPRNSHLAPNYPSTLSASASMSAISGLPMLQHRAPTDRALSRFSAKTHDFDRGQSHDSTYRGHHQKQHDRNHLRYKRSASDLQSGNAASKTDSLPTSSTSPHPGGHSRQLVRKRSLPSLKASPPSQGSQGSNTGSTFRSTRPSGSRLTASTAASRARAAETADQLARMAREIEAAPARPSTPVTISARGHHQAATRISVQTRSRHSLGNTTQHAPGGTPQVVARILKRTTQYGDGLELDGIDDLDGATSTSPSSQTNSYTLSQSIRRNSNQSSSGNMPRRNGRKKSQQQNKPALIRPLGGSATSQKMVKGMRWNPRLLRWEGNEGVLRDFDQVIQSSTRPALISQLTGSSTSSALASMPGYTSPLSSESSTLMQSIASGARVVGDMLFDPVQMRWIHKSGAEEEDVFAELDDESLGSRDHDLVKFGTESDHTIRARRIRSSEAFQRMTDPWAPLSEQDLVDQTAAHSGTSGADKIDLAIRRAVAKGHFPQDAGIDRELWDACMEASRRHKLEVEGFLRPSPASGTRSRVKSEASDRSLTLEDIDRPRPHLYYLEKIAKSVIRPSTVSSPSPNIS
ncbi:hypothetical protein BCV70DRAFT_200985 [Testicularia cyperi]|uniref:Uncharacterized protein n=1 Tax=Testicularia cyperi TaxID=1882483 RepID=A0A317XM78_9BASI|nr:hypothetical protein BCV70DRAFT_200985 [Testicularia cyperi]